MSADVEGGGGWKTIGFVNGHGNSNSPKYYSYVDKNVSAGKYKYRLKQINFDGAFEYSDIVEISFMKYMEFNLSQNFPNPFNPTTTIAFTIPSFIIAGEAKQSVVLKVYDILGNEIATLLNEPKSPGQCEIEFNASNLASGIYYYTLQTGDFVQTKKMVLLK